MNRGRLRVGIVGMLLLALVAESAKGQVLNADSIMNKVENFGHYLLYRNHDTTYIQNHSDKFTFKLVGVTKFNSFKLKDGQNNSSILYRPDRRLNLGFGLAYKWFAIDLAFNFGIGEESDFRNSRTINFAGTIFSSKQFVSANYQYYYGHQLTKTSGVDIEDVPEESIRDDIRTVYFGLQYIFVLDYDKFSLKAPFIHNEIQKKSAGSFLFGANFGLYNIAADSSIVPSNFDDDFEDEMNLTDLNATILGINAGYMYTFVFKSNWYATLSFIPGAGINFGDYQTDIRRVYDTHLYLGYKTMGSIGYNSEKFFAGIQMTVDAFNTRVAQNLRIRSAHGNAKAFIGMRFQ